MNDGMYSLTTSLQLLYYYIRLLCNDPTISYNNKNNNNISMYIIDL